MVRRLDWLKLNMRRGRPTRVRARVVCHFLAFEFYYWLCRLLGYRPRHYLDYPVAGVQGLRAGDKYLVIWPRLPLTIRLLDRIFSPTGHARFAPYSSAAAEDAGSKGRRMAVMTVRAGVLGVSGSSS
jgi:hypothetical protein